ncbi:hypothetical protein [Chryseobacterium shandongense]|jgi:hypothetical protein|uniref:hypothetical protein n=1 Tax=Chryseobacterium shandongense TaxID=1493872 RepID=UPI000F4F505D|nr:hypothetical protein [Chryseobacterium shandongense]AZA56576.1 hypothetical protein EG350_05035 [Chryseobacterium shandongense]
MELSKRNILLFFTILFVIIIVFFIAKYNQTKKEYSSELNGKVESLRYIGRGDGYQQVKFEGEKEFNALCIIYVGSENKDDLKIGDSIYKEKNSEDYQIYRQDSSGNYSFYKTLKNKP